MLWDSPRFISTPSRGREEYALKSIKDNIRERSGYTCDYCGEDAKQVEHINPVSGQGINDPRNLILACGKCNRDKGAAPVTEFLDRRDDLDISVEDLPIYGDLILETPPLPREYRRVRRATIVEFRKEGEFSGANAYTELERRFRQNLWTTVLGYCLCLKYPTKPAAGSGMPGHRRAVIPLIYSLVSDTRIPIYNLLVSLTSSAATRHLIDDMVYYRHHESYGLKSAVNKALEDTEGQAKSKLEEKISNTEYSDLTEEQFRIPEELEGVPVRERELLLLDIDDFRAAGGHMRGGIDRYEIRVPDAEPGSDIPVRITDIYHSHAVGVPLSIESTPAIEYVEDRASKIIRAKEQ
ncbi:HNH endonuclease [Halobaculum sp. D14]|uniref:HNH endonuclease n=1 Tax=Halobaculum sp. D14 TaxID=3421642 RepID=UPI003EC084B2